MSYKVAPETVDELRSYLPHGSGNLGERVTDKYFTVDFVLHEARSEDIPPLQEAIKPFEGKLVTRRDGSFRLIVNRDLCYDLNRAALEAWILDGNEPEIFDSRVVCRYADSAYQKGDYEKALQYYLRALATSKLEVKQGRTKDMNGDGRAGDLEIHSLFCLDVWRCYNHLGNQAECKIWNDKFNTNDKRERAEKARMLQERRVALARLAKEFR